MFFWEIFGGKSYAAAMFADTEVHACADIVVLRSPAIPFPDLKHVGTLFSKLKFRVFCYS